MKTIILTFLIFTSVALYSQDSTVTMYQAKTERGWLLENRAGLYYSPGYSKNAIFMTHDSLIGIFGDTMAVIKALLLDLRGSNQIGGKKAKSKTEK